MFHVKQPSAETVKVYKQLIERYHDTLDLVSAVALHNLDDMITEGFEYAQLVSNRLGAGQPLLDIGSGVGFPGIPLAVAFPDNPVYLVERRQKRASFLKIVSSQLGLANVSVLSADVRRVAPPEARFSVVTAQAVASFLDIYCLSRHLHADRVTLVSRKGADWPTETRALERGISASPLSVRHSTSRRHGTLVAIELPGGLPCPPSA